MLVSFAPAQAPVLDTLRTALTTLRARPDPMVRPDDAWLATVAQAIAAVPASGRTEPELLAVLYDVAQDALVAGCHEHVLAWLQPFDAALADAAEPLPRHRFAALLGLALRQLRRPAEVRQRLQPAWDALQGSPFAERAEGLAVVRVLSQALQDLRDYRACVPLAQRTVELARALAVPPAQLLQDLNELGNAQHRTGQRQAAYDTYLAALELARAHWPAEHAVVLRQMRNLAAVTAQLGDYRRAYELMQPFLELLERTRPADDLDLADVRQGLSQILVQLDELDAAYRLQAQALEVLEADPQRAPALLRTGLQFFARVLHARHDYEGSRVQILKAIAMLEASGSGHERDLGTARTLLGVLERRRGDLTASRRLLEQSYAGLLEALGGAHNFTQIAASDLLSTCRCQGDTSRAVALALRLLDEAVNSLRQSALAARPTARLVAIQHIGVGQALSLAFDVDPAVRQQLLARTLLVSQLLKGAAHHVVREQNRRQAELAGELQRKSAELAAAAQANDAVRVTRLAGEKEAIEHRLQAGAEPAAELVPSLAQLIGSLPEGAAAVAVVPFNRRTITATTPPVVESAHWLAGLVLRANGELALVDLGSLATMTDAVDTMSAATHGALRRRVIDPLRGAAGTAKVLYLSLDDSLLLVPWDALPTEDGGMVGAQVELRRVTTLLDLTTMAGAVPTPTADTARLLVVGDVAYGDAPAANGRHAFSPLPGSRLEMQEVEASFLQRFPNAPRASLRGNAVDKDALQRAVVGATYVHLATHGFLRDDQVMATTSAAGGGTLPSASFQLAPFALSGLAIRDANTAADGAGIVTADELQYYDLSSCHLAVLSACESALGAWSKGQGLASLQQALHIAGARHVLATMWPVDDAAARRFMQHFYAALWQQPDAPYRALQQARQRCVQDGLSFRDWAAFQLSGT